MVILLIRQTRIDTWYGLRAQGPTSRHGISELKLGLTLLTHDPIFKRAVPTFAPGTHARRKTHHQLRLLGRSQTSDAANERSRNMLSFQRTRSGTGWIKGKSFKRLSGSHAGTRSDGLSPGSSPASTHSSVGPRGQHRGAFFRASVANLDA